MTCGAIGSFSRLAVQGGSTPRTFSSSSERHAFITEDIKPQYVFSGGERGIGEIGCTTGARRVTQIVYSGNIVFEGTKHEITKWLPRAMWSSSSSPYNLTLDPASHEFDILLDREESVYRYESCLVNALTIFSKTGSLCYAVANIVATNVSRATAWPDPEPTYANTAIHYPFAHYDTEFTLNSVDIPVEQSILSIRNNLIPVANGSLTPQKFRSMGRDIIYSGTAAFTSDTIAELDDAIDTPADAELSISNGFSGSVVATIQNMHNIGKTDPTIESPLHVPIAFALKAGKDDYSTPEMSVAIT